MSNMIEAQLLRKVSISCYRIFYFTILSREELLWQPGQFIQCIFIENGVEIKRPYSFAHDPSSRELELHTVYIAGGTMSEKLEQLQCGETLLLSKDSYGYLTVSEIANNKTVLWFVATTTGVAPFISMLRSGLLSTFSNVLLYYSGKTIESLMYHNELSQAQNQFAWFNYQPITTSEQPRVQFYLKEKLKNYTNKLEQLHVMFCGNPQMIHDCLQLGNELGLTRHRRKIPGNITFERYWVSTHS
ncbi:MAG: FAD-binding oxidoreductase [Methylacidiphilales bacterium]|nr:FAD-binding oxidoreductase [Candidatus Methylacidiphilales bacterium]